MRRVHVALSLSTLLLLIACVGPTHETRFAFIDGEVRLTLQGDAEETRSASEAVREELQGLIPHWHPWQDSSLTALNQALAEGRSFQAPTPLLRLIRAAQPINIHSDGMFDPAIGELVSLWGFDTQEFPIRSPAPTDAQLKAWQSARAHLSDLNIQGDIVSSAQRTLQLDFSAMTEGAAAAIALRTLRDHGIRRGQVRFGNDLIVLGDDHRITVADPFGGELAQADLDDGEALVVTGNFNRYRQAPSGARWGHVLDPRSGQPALGSAMVLVVHKDSTLADAAATALSAGGPARFEYLSKRLRLGCAMMVTDENELLITRALQERMEFERMPIPLGPPLDNGSVCNPRQQDPMPGLAAQ